MVLVFGTDKVPVLFYIYYCQFVLHYSLKWLLISTQSTIQLIFFVKADEYFIFK